MDAQFVEHDGLIIPAGGQGWAETLPDNVKADARSGDGWAQVCAYCSVASLSNAEFVDKWLVRVYTHAMEQYAGQMGTTLPLDIEPDEYAIEMAGQFQAELQEAYNELA